jgi:type IV pilus assembly protein PilM
LSSLSGASLQQAQSGGIYRRLTSWLDAMPHPAGVCEVAANRVAAAHWSGKGALESGAASALDAGSIIPSPVDQNVTNADSLRSALKSVFDQTSLSGQSIALLLPDPVVRIFIFPFETLPRRADEAIPLLRWRLKKSVPFDVDDTVVSSMRQTGRDGGLEVITAVARQSIIREYEQAVEAAGGEPGVVLSSTMACLPLLSDAGATLLLRAGAKCLTTVIVRGSNLCVYRSTSTTKDAAQVDVQAVLDEIFPAVAYHQDTWGGELDRVVITGFGDREETVRLAVSNEMKVQTGNLTDGASGIGLSPDARTMLSQGQEALVGWMANGA